MIPAGVAYHHAGLSLEDRLAIEKGYLAGDINVICCTSTLAVGVNLPCHMVIIKNTITYQSTGVCKEYSDLEVMQMLGRAGRPQFDNNALAVIMTRLSQVPVYEKMISGQEVLESWCKSSRLVMSSVADISQPPSKSDRPPQRRDRSRQHHQRTICQEVALWHIPLRSTQGESRALQDRKRCTWTKPRRTP
jgi:superfamily II DNA helicase RecQ